MRRGSLIVETGGGTTTEAPGLASQAEAEAGSDNTKMMTPLRVAQAFAALGGGGDGSSGGGPVSEALCWVDAAEGDDGTGDGSAGRPFATLQAAYMARVAGSCSFVVIGSVGGLSVSAGLDLTLIGIGVTRSLVGGIQSSVGGVVRGNGRGMIWVASITAQPPDGLAGGNWGENGSNGDDGASPAGLTAIGLFVQENIQSVGSSGGNGGPGGSGGGVTNGFSGGEGGDAGSGGSITVEDCHVEGEVASYGGNGGDGGGGGDAPEGPWGETFSGGMGGASGNGGTGGEVTVRGSTVGEASSHSGTYGSAGEGGWGSMTSGAYGGDGLGGGNGVVVLHFTTHVAASHINGGRQLRAVLMGGSFIAEDDG